MTCGARKIPAIPTNCGECPVKDLTICHPLTGHDVEIVQRFKIGDRILPARSQIYRQGEICTELYNLLDGWIILYHILETGRFQILDFVLPGAFLGYQPDLEQPMLHGADCLTDVSVCVFPRKPFTSLIEMYPKLAVQLAWLNANDTVIAREHLSNMGTRGAEVRIAHLLLELYSRLCRQGFVSDHQPIEIPLTQQHIAEALGLSSVYVCQSLKRLRALQLVMFRNRRLQILDPDALAKVADFEELYVA